jgi:tetratricopeptide (TPR) repeat protein
VWGRKKDSGPPAGEIVTLDEQIRRLRSLASTSARPETVGPLITVLTARATLASMQDRYDDAREDRRAAAGLLRGFDGQPSPVDPATVRLVWMGAALSEHRAGDLDAALEAATRAVGSMPRPPAEDIEMYAAFLQDLADLRQQLRDAGRLADVVGVAELISDLATRLTEADEATFGVVLGTALVNEAAARANAGDLESAGAVNEEAIGVLREHQPTSSAITLALGNRARWERRSGQWEEAIATEQLALAGVRSGPATTRQEIERLNSLFLTLVHSGRPAEAERTSCEAVELARRLVDADPAQTSLLATLLGNQANVRRELHRYDDALLSSEEALSIRERLVLSDPSSDSDRGLAMILNNHAGVLRRLGRLEEAAHSAGRSVALRRRLAEDGKPNTTALLANSLNSHAEQLGHLGDCEQAVRLAEEARDLYDGLPPPGAVKKYLRANQETLGRVLALAGRHDDAVAAAQRAVELGRAAADEAPGEVRELASCWESLADRLTEVGRTSEAEMALAEAARLRTAQASWPSSCTTHP